MIWVYGVYLLLLIFGTYNIWQEMYSMCPKVETVDDVDLEIFVKHTWYIQAQQIVTYQQPDQFFCVTATYALENRRVPLFDGDVISVYNYGNDNRVNGHPTNTKDGMVLCARVPNANDPAKLLVAPCFLPNIAGGEYWIIGLGKQQDEYSWAVISGGPPLKQYPDGGCTTLVNKTNHAGLWIFSSKPIMDKTSYEQAISLLKEKGYTLSQLYPVEQMGCLYNDSFVK